MHIMSSESFQPHSDADLALPVCSSFESALINL